MCMKSTDSSVWRHWVIFANFVVFPHCARRHRRSATPELAPHALRQRPHRAAGRRQRAPQPPRRRPPLRPPPRAPQPRRGRRRRLVEPARAPGQEAGMVESALKGQRGKRPLVERLALRLNGISVNAHRRYFRILISVPGDSDRLDSSLCPARAWPGVIPACNTRVVVTAPHRLGGRS